MPRNDFEFIPAAFDRREICTFGAHILSDTLAAGMHPAIVIRSSYDSVVSWRKVNGPNDFRDSQNGSPKCTLMVV
ncbi:hypothetical protein OUZ56_022427 [Daphnia magna]|uniref:Uncharacterized protein n=1 Tax=Daphnia magna TaxID=35525 RepID=A0ABR0AWC0_9CRUS|nr:hypothetical protein OUZ56_022427 [Daphnia magna]